MKRSVPAYTLAEVLVTMVISALIMLIVYWIMSQFGLSFSKLSSRFQIGSQEFDFERVATQIWEDSDSLVCESDSLICWRNNQFSVFLFKDSTWFLHKDQKLLLFTDSVVLKPEEFLNQNRNDSLLETFSLEWKGPLNNRGPKLVYTKLYPKPF